MQTTHVPSIKRKYTVWGVSSQSADKLQFDVEDETTGRRTKTTVASYFKDRYKGLRYVSLHLKPLFVQHLATETEFIFGLLRADFGLVSCYAHNFVNL